jgi:seryl-tRNA synthetase
MKHNIQTYFNIKYIMLDIKLIAQNPEMFQNALKKRSIDSIDVQSIISLDFSRKENAKKLQEIQAQKNKIANEIGVLKRNKGDEKDIAKLMEESKSLDSDLINLEKSDNEVAQKIKSVLEIIPNILQDEVPFGKDESENKLVKEWGSKPHFNFQPKEHWEIGEKLGLLDAERAAKIAGSRFSIMRGRLAKLERVLRSFMVDICVNEFGYEEMFIPYLMNEVAAYRSGQLPKFTEDMFKTNTGHFLIPTAETSLVNVYADEIIATEKLPIRICAYSPCFRSEAGSAGRDTIGILRQHQFTKVEMVSIVEASKSEEEHQRMLKCATTILERLGLHYRVVMLCSGDTGFCSSKTYDIQVWMPGQGKYREICSCSNTTDFQARRAGIRTKSATEKGTKFVHMLNSSALPLGRTIIAIMENYQTEDGDFKIPEVLGF